MTRTGSYPRSGVVPARRRLSVRIPDNMVRDFKEASERIIDAIQDLIKAEEAIVEKAKAEVGKVHEKVEGVGLTGAVNTVVDEMSWSMTVEREELLNTITWVLGDLEFSLFSR